MRSLRAFLLRLVATVWPRAREREIDAEFESHLQLHTDDNIRAGMSPHQAERAARLRLGNVTVLKEEYRDRAGWPWLEATARDARYALRTFRQSPSFTIIVVLTLGLGIGATTAIFGVFEVVLLRPLPYGEPQQLVHIGESNPLKRWTDEVASPANFADWRRLNRVFTDVAAYAPGRAFLTSGGEPRRIEALRSTGNLFDVLKVKPLLGRSFRYEETMAGHDRVVMLSYGFWQAAFSGDPGIVGRSLQIDDKSMEVIGIAPRGFYFPARDIEIYLPLGVKPELFTQMRRP
ncbi:MAG: ABC transporter permease, partial [Acidobacteriaceae bacterium]|nr:ABC transporter permease [Acidobacteriaceae bacterium]